MPRPNAKRSPTRGRRASTPTASPEETALGIPGGSDFVVDFRNDDLADPKLRELHAIWVSKCKSGRLPGRADFDPTELPPDILPWITIFDVEGERFRIRIIGTGIVDALGIDHTGQYVDDLPDADDLQTRARWVVRNAKPFFMVDLPVTWIQDRYERYSALCVPLATNGIDVDKLLYVLRFGE